MAKTYRQMWIDAELHRVIKVRAAAQSKTLQEYLRGLVEGEDGDGI